MNTTMNRLWVLMVFVAGCVPAAFAPVSTPTPSRTFANQPSAFGSYSMSGNANPMIMPPSAGRPYYAGSGFDPATHAEIAQAYFANAPRMTMPAQAGAPPGTPGQTPSITGSTTGTDPRVIQGLQNAAIQLARLRCEVFNECPPTRSNSARRESGNGQ